MGIKFIDATGSGTIADAIAAIEFAIAVKQAFAATGAADIRVLSNSWGGPEFSQALLDEIVAARRAPTCCSSPAPGTRLRQRHPPDVPRQLQCAERHLRRRHHEHRRPARGSRTTAPTSVHLGAPGVDILSTMPGEHLLRSQRHVDGDAARVGRRGAGAVAVRHRYGGAEGDAAGHGRSGAPRSAVTHDTGGRLNVNSALRACILPPHAPIWPRPAAIRR